MNSIRCVVAAAALLASCAGACAAVAPVQVRDGMLTDVRGMTLYVLDDDGTAGHSACTGSCLKLWKPVRAGRHASLAEGFTVIVREDGRRQLAYRGRPLYRWWNDRQPGDHDADGLRGKSHIARP